MKEIETVYASRGFHGCESKCGLRIISIDDGRVVVICSELPDNPGTSVTNFAEELADLVCAEYRIEPRRLVFIEHYVPHKGHPKETWDLVTFKLLSDGVGTVFFEPSWRPVRESDWQAFGLPAPASV